MSNKPKLRPKAAKGPRCPCGQPRQWMTKEGYGLVCFHCGRPKP